MLIRTSILLLSFLSLCAHAGSDAKVATLLNNKSAPSGVVFEIVQGSKNDLTNAIKKVNDYSIQLRKIYPNLSIAVVSHGKEQFALLTENTAKYSQVHDTVKQLVTKHDIPVHVCGTHASWYDKSESDFPDYVDVSPAGPAQIKDYQNLGYELIVLTRSN